MPTNSERKRDLHKERVLDITDAVFPQTTYGEIDGERVRMKGGIEGQTVRVRLKKKGGKKIGKILTVEEPSPVETETPCPAFGRCGGCTFLTVPYEKEAKLIFLRLLRLYERELPETKLLDVRFTPAKSRTGYRNKMEYTFGDEVKGGELTLGLHARGMFHTIVDIDGCTIAPRDFETIRKSVEAYFCTRGVKHYHKITHEGSLRYLVVREGKYTGDILVRLVTTGDFTMPEDFVPMLTGLELDGRITGILHGMSDSVSDTTRTEREEILYGSPIYEEKLLGLTFEISPESFFQTNSEMAEVLYRKALETMTDIDDKTVFDFYSGTGTLAQIFAKKAREVIAVEIVPEAVEAAKRNAEKNGLTNIRFHAADVKDIIDSIEEVPDLLILDPPREGIHPKAIGGLIRFGAREILYISCNPVTQTRDIGIFEEAGYTLESLEFVDLFPGTPNCEAIALLRKK